MGNLVADVDYAECPYDPLEMICLGAVNLDNKLCEKCLSLKVKRLRKQLIHLRMKMREKGEL